MITGSDLKERGFIRRVFASSVAGAFNWDRDGALAVTGEAFVAQVGERLGGDINMHGYFNALGAPNLDVSTPNSCSAMPTCPEWKVPESRERRTRPQNAPKTP